MRIGRLIVDGFISRYGIQIELGVWIKSHYWLTILIKAVFGSAFFGLSGVEGGAVSYGLQRSGYTWRFVWSKYDKKREARIRELLKKREVKR